MHPHVALLHQLALVRPRRRHHSQDPQLPLSSLASILGLPRSQLETLAQQKRFDELDDTVERAEQGEAQCDVNQVETGLLHVVAWPLLVSDREVHHQSQQNQVNDDEHYDRKGQHFSEGQFFPESLAVDPASDQFVGVSIFLMANLAVEALGTQDLFALQRVLRLFLHPFLKTFTVDKLHAAATAAYRHQLAALLLAAQTDAALSHRITRSA